MYYIVFEEIFMICFVMSINYIDLIVDNKIIIIFDINSFLLIFEIYNINDSILF